MLARLSFRYKLPLTLVATSMLTAVVLGAVMLGYGYLNRTQALVRHAHEIADALIATARPALRNDDVWAAYTTLRGGTTPQGGARPDRALRILLDARARVVAANEPDRFPVGRQLGGRDQALAGLGEWLAVRGIPGRPVVLDRSVVADRLILVAPVLSEATPIGALVLAYPGTRLTAGFVAQARQGGLAIIAVLAFIVPVGWYLGHRIASPLARFAARLSTVGQRDPGDPEFAALGPSDEIGQLHAAYNTMLRDLQHKAALERQVVISERLAAIGRLTSSVAHEVNNPLGGMLIAVDTLKRTETDNPRVQRSAALLERGLEQIRQTVSALLVQARPEDRMLIADDLEDVRTLLAARLEDQGGALDWRIGFAGQLPLPATPVRQIVINLVLNAIEAVATSGGRVACAAIVEPEALVLRVSDDGPAIPPAFLEQLFEPFAGLRSEGTGLGLWITYQTVEQLGGSIEVDSDDGGTRFVVRLPLIARTEVGYERTGT